ncbi:MAG: GDSL-type esterase/lipase family protein, partial [Gemmataceae bacterium]
MLPLLLILLAPPSAPAPMPDFTKWEKEIAALEARWEKSPPEKNGVVFTGSSSIRLWNLKKSFPRAADYVNAGFGGSTVPDSTHFLPRLVARHKPRAVVLYAGDNDLAQKRPVATVVADTKAFFAAVHQALPQAIIYYLPVKPSASRAALLEQQTAVNLAVQKFIAEDPARRTYVDLVSIILKKDGSPDATLFQADQLHLNDAGYAKWTTEL